MAKRQNLDGKMGEAASNSKFAALALAVVGASPAAVTAVEPNTPKPRDRAGKKPDISNLTGGAGDPGISSANPQQGITVTRAKAGGKKPAASKPAEAVKAPPAPLKTELLTNTSPLGST